MITLEWADGQSYPFALYGKQIEELQSVCGNVGLGLIFQRVSLGQWFFGDLYHTVRLGLIGGGMGPVEAMRKVDMYCGKDHIEMALVAGEGANSVENVAQAILKSVMLGFRDIPKTGEAPVEDQTGS